MNTHEPPPSSDDGPAKTDAPGPAERLLDRLKALIGLRTGSLRSDLAEVLAEDTVKEEFSPAERAMLQNILTLEKQRIGDLMVPRADIVAVQKDVPIGQLLRAFATAAHSRLVVYDDTLDDPTGMVHIRDLVAHITGRAMLPPAAEGKPKRRKRLPADLDLKAVDLLEPLSATNLIRPILFVPASMPAIDLLVKMQATRIHLALVIDEYGGTDGVVSMEDIVEQIVGDIEDEHDDEAAMITRQADGSFIADARAGLEEAAEKIGAVFAADEELEDVDTLGGLIVTLAGRVPVRGEIIAGPGEFEIEVLDADPRRVKRLRISRRPPEPQKREARRRTPEENVPAAPSLPKSDSEAPTTTSPPADESKR
ncbi:MAG: HlyC/CorC family transporter [Bradyrhizobiaceae bacterium]|nr:HlyC/CorC family transporter [Bradyrhizobiaceae bacterium]